MQRIAITLACFIICVNSVSQQYSFVHYTPKDGLVNSRVKKAYQDSKGRMYFLTYGGLSVYDGTRFRNYTMQNGLASNVVNDIIEVGDDSLLIATNSSNHLNVLVKGKIEILNTGIGRCPIVNQFYRHDDNKIYLSSDDGLFVLEKDRLRRLNDTLLSDQSQLPYLGSINGSGNFLVISTNEMKFRKGLFLYDIKNDRISDALPLIGAFLLGKDDKNCIWINTSDKLFIIDNIALKNGRLSFIPPAKGFEKIKNYSTANIAFDKNCIWLVYRNEQYRNKEIRRIEHDGTIFHIPIPDQTGAIYQIIVDKEKSIWLCNDGEGVFKVVNSPLRIFENSFSESTEGHITHVFYNNETTWYNTNTSKLFKVVNEDTTAFICNMTESPSIFYSGSEKLIAKDFNNIYEGSIHNNSINFKKIISLSGPDFFNKKLLVDRNGCIIASQKSGIGVWKNNKLIYHFPMPANDLAEELSIDKNNFLWAVRRYDETDVFTINTTKNDSQYLQLSLRIPYSEVKGSPRCFVIDKKGFVWIGTRDHGLFAYKIEDRRYKEMYHFNTSNGLTDNFITTLAFDSLNNIIIGTQTGLDRLIYDSKKDYRIENLSKSGNFFAYINQVWIDAKDQPYALTNAGVILQVSTALTNTTDNSPQLLLEEIKINAQSIAPKKKAKLDHHENNISFFVAAPSFIDEKQVTYSYLLEGSGNKQWSDTTPSNSVINLTNLSAGKYSLKVRAFFPSAIYPPAELLYSFEITPPWWQTWWFRLASGLLFIGLLIVAARFYYRRKLEKQKIALEKQRAIEKERTRIATDMHDDLGAGLSRIKFLSEKMKVNNGNNEAILNDIEKICAYSDEMAAKMGEIVWALNEKNDTVADLVAFTRSYVQEYLSGQNIQCELNTPLELPSTFITGEMRQHIFLSVKECLHNIVKHARASQVYFSVRLNGEIEITIHDNGKGIDLNMTRPFSNGIENIQKRINEIQGKVIFLNQEGTKVVISIPHNV